MAGEAPSSEELSNKLCNKDLFMFGPLSISIIYSFLHSFSHSLIYSFIYSFMYLFIHLVHSFSFFSFNLTFPHNNNDSFNNPTNNKQQNLTSTTPSTNSYAGHGSGSKYLNGGCLQMLHLRSAALLMGCSSGRLWSHGVLEPVGILNYYFLAGSSVAADKLIPSHFI